MADVKGKTPSPLTPTKKHLQIGLHVSTDIATERLPTRTTQVSSKARSLAPHRSHINCCQLCSAVRTGDIHCAGGATARPRFLAARSSSMRMQASRPPSSSTRSSISLSSERRARRLSGRDDSHE
eukprot:scaffold311118_cov31-Tisochrysis_lutea.AAC.1